jgi:hypothetical protein
MGRLVWPGGGHSHCGVISQIAFIPEAHIEHNESCSDVGFFCLFISVIFYAVKFCVCGSVGEQALLLVDQFGHG